MLQATRKTARISTLAAGICLVWGAAAFVGCNQSANEDNKPEVAASTDPKSDQQQSSVKKSFQKDGVVGEANLSVIIDNISVLEGTLSVALYDNMHNYSQGGSARGERIQVSGSTHTIEFTELPLGEYAIRVMHDINNNQELDTNSYGIPKEPFAFSNNAKGVMGPASWEDAKFTIDGSDVTQTISFPK